MLSVATVLIIIAILVVAILYSAVRILREYERGVVFMLGRFWKVKGPGLILIIPVFQQWVRVDLRKTIILLFKDQDDRLRVIRIINDLERNLSRYIGTVTAINLGVGVITAFGAWMLGFSNPALFGRY